MVSPLDVNLWDVIEIDGRLYDVVSDEQGRATLDRRSQRRWTSFWQSGAGAA
jgi:hypothetical protein